MKTPEIADQLLIDLLLMKDRQTFKFLYETYSPSLHGSIIDIVADKEVAANILQNAFSSACATIDGFKKVRSNLYTWMLHIAMRFSMVAQRSIESWPTVNQLQAISAGIDALLNQMELGPSTVIKLVYYNGHSKREAAKLLNVSIHLIDSMLQKGLSELEQFINSHCIDRSMIINH